MKLRRIAKLTAAGVLIALTLPVWKASTQCVIFASDSRGADNG